MLKFIFRKKLSRNVADEVEVGYGLLSEIRSMLLREPAEAYPIYAEAVHLAVAGVMERYRLTESAAIYGDRMTWRDLASVIDNLQAASVHGMNMRNNSYSPTARNLGLASATASSIIATCYQMKYSLMNFPEFSGDATGLLHRYAADLMKTLLRVHAGSLPAKEFGQWLQGNPVPRV